MKVRAFAEAAYDTLIKSGASKEGPPSSTRDVAEEFKATKIAMISMLPTELQEYTGKMPSTFGISLELQAALVADLVFYRRFTDQASWARAIESFMQPWFSDNCDASARYTEVVRQHYEAIDRAKFAPEQNGLEDADRGIALMLDLLASSPL